MHPNSVVHEDSNYELSKYRLLSFSIKLIESFEDIDLRFLELLLEKGASITKKSPVFYDADGDEETYYNEGLSPLEKATQLKDRYPQILE